MTGIELKPAHPAFSRLMLLVKLETFDGAVLILTLLLTFPVSFVVVAIPDDDDGRKNEI